MLEVSNIFCFKLNAKFTKFKVEVLKTKGFLKFCVAKISHFKKKLVKEISPYSKQFST